MKLLERSMNKEGGSTFSDNPGIHRIAVARTLGFAVFLCSLPCLAGVSIAEPEKLEEQTGNFCDAFRNMGKFYSDSENPYIQSFSIFGRMHWQYGHLEGRDAFGRDFTYDTAEFRRFRLGAKAKVFKYFNLKAQA